MQASCAKSHTLPTACQQKRAGFALQLPHLPRLDYVDEDVPFLLFESDEVALLADADRIAVDGDFGAGGAGWAERDFVHGSLPPSMRSQTTPCVPGKASQLLRIFLTSRRRLSRSASFCSSNARTWTHGPDFADRRSTMWRISFNVRPSRRAWVTKCRTPKTSASYTRYPAGVRRGFDTMPRASYRRRALRLTPLRVATSPIVKSCSRMD